LGVAWLPPFAELCEMAVSAKFIQHPPCGDVTRASYKPGVTRANEKFPALGFNAMLANGEQNLFVWQCSVRKFFVPRPANPFFSGGFEPRLGLRPAHTGDKLVPVFVRLATQPDALPGVFAQPRIKRRINQPISQRSFNPLCVQGQ